MQIFTATWRSGLLAAAWLAAATLFTATVVRLAGQSGPTFELISIRPVETNGKPILIDPAYEPVQPGGQYVHPHTALLFLVAYAYDVKDPGRRLVGLPKWGGQPYSVAAKAGSDFSKLPPRENAEQVKLMVRNMLRDRFKLQLHTETRKEDVLIMTVDKGGLRMKEVAAPVPPERPGRFNAAMSDSGGRLIAQKGTMRDLAQSATIFLKQEVVDQTGLTGYYDADIRWTAPGGAAPTAGLGPEGINLFLTELREQFGLRFTKGSALLEYWIIDHVEPPTENP
jgi:uncharacterized protein (TIGR03435 family)